MLNIGCHLSTTKGFENMGKEALEIGANTFQFFTRNPRGGKAKDIDINDMEALLSIAKENNFSRDVIQKIKSKKNWKSVSSKYF